MARKIQEIYNELITEKSTMAALNELQPEVDNAQTLLNDVASPSKVADWRLWLWLFAFGTFILEKSRDIFRAEMDEKILQAKPHNLKWYQLLALKFQYGHALVFDEDLEKYVYAIDSPDDRIITAAATEEVNGRVVMKTAASGIALTTAQHNAFKAYMGQLKDAGTDILYISGNPDKFKVVMDVYYDPLVMNPDGTLILDPSRKPVEEQIEEYISNLDFNAAFVLTKFVDEIQEAEGVVDPVLEEVQTESDLLAYAPVEVKYVAYGGYYTWDAANSTINYIPNVA